MNRYLEQLHAEIAHAIQNVPKPPIPSEGLDIWFFISYEDEMRASRHKPLEEWTGISADAFPADDLLTDDQVEALYNAASGMLSAYNMHIIFHLCDTPVRAQYRVMKAFWNQQLPMLQHNDGFFETCTDGNRIELCLLGDKCHCRFFREQFPDTDNEPITPEEERAMELDIEIRHIRKKYDDDWMKYYPYHLDPDYDDEYGNPFDYGFGDLNEDEDDDDNWWRR
jgi:hypothetical protein